MLRVQFDLIIHEDLLMPLLQTVTFVKNYNNELFKEEEAIMEIIKQHMCYAEPQIQRIKELFEDR